MSSIRILGAGLSGLSAAINLAKAGYKVNVFETNKNVGQRFHNDLQGLENWSEKEDILEQFRKMNIEINFDCEPVSDLIVTNGTKTKEVSSPRPLFYLVKRGSLPGSFDQGLKEQAIRLGVNIHCGKTFPKNQARIVATGPIINEIFIVAKGIVFKTKIEDTAILLLNDRAAFKGYAYLLITKGYGCMCAAVFGKLSAANSCFKETKRIFSHILKLDIQEPKEVAGVGSFSTKSIFQKDGTLLVGEAAGLQDFLWGFGMRYAVTSGFLAAGSIINNEDYGEIAKKRFSHKLKASVVNRYLWEKLHKSDYLFLVNNARFFTDHLYSLHKYNLIQRAIYPVALSYMRRSYPKLRL